MGIAPHPRSVFLLTPWPPNRSQTRSSARSRRSSVPCDLTPVAKATSRDDPCSLLQRVTIHLSRPRTVRSRPEGIITMATEDSAFGHEAELPGEPTTRSLADLLDADSDAVAERLKEKLDRIRQAERDAERASGEVRLY